MCICHNFNNSILSGIIIYYSMWACHKKHWLAKVETPRNYANNYVRHFGNSQQFGIRCIYRWYSRHEISYPSFTIVSIFCLKRIDINFWPSMLALLCFYFSVNIYLLLQENIQLSMLDHKGYNNILIENKWKYRF